MTPATVRALLLRAGRLVDDDLLDQWQERASIRQWEGRMLKWAAEAAALLGRPVAEVRALARRHEWRAVRVDKVLRFHPVDVRRLAVGRAN